MSRSRRVIAADTPLTIGTASLLHRLDSVSHGPHIIRPGSHLVAIRSTFAARPQAVAVDDPGVVVDHDHGSGWKHCPFPDFTWSEHCVYGRLDRAAIALGLSDAAGKSSLRLDTIADPHFALVHGGMRQEDSSLDHCQSEGAQSSGECFRASIGLIARMTPLIDDKCTAATHSALSLPISS